MQTSSSDADRQKVWDLIKDIKITMMVTQDVSHRLSARPMVAAQTEFDGLLRFLTRDETPKVDEIEAEHKVLLAYSHPSKQHYVSVAGTARTTRDRAKIKAAWSEPMRTWFPKGEDDPSIAVIEVSVETAEYWDAPSSAVVYAYGYAKAVLTGESPKPAENKKVTF